MHPNMPVDWNDTLGDLMYDILIKYSYGKQNIWVRTTSSGGQSGGVDMLTFTGQPRKLFREKNNCAKRCFLGSRLFASGWEDHFKVNLPLGDFYDVDHVVPVFEITRNPKDWHPNPYVSVPLPGPWENWAEVHRLALRIDHMKDGKVIGQYQHTHDHSFPFQKRGQGSQHNLFLTGAWSRAMAWIATLTNLDWADRSWFGNWALQPYNVIVEELEPSSLSQFVIAKSGPREIQEPPKRVDVEANMEAMEKLYASEHQGTSVGFWSPDLLPNGRASCDACHISMANPSAMHCPVVCLDCSPRKVEIPNSRKTGWACDFCMSLGRLCSFTPDHYLELHFDAFKSLGYARVLGSHTEMSSSEEHAARLLLEGAAVPEFAKEVNPIHEWHKDDLAYYQRHSEGMDKCKGGGYATKPRT